jgi:hypothetical protein
VGAAFRCFPEIPRDTLGYSRCLRKKISAAARGSGGEGKEIFDCINTIQHHVRLRIQQTREHINVS